MLGIIPELINNNKEFREKLRIIDSKSDKLKKENEVLKSKVSVAEKTVDPFDK